MTRQERLLRLARLRGDRAAELIVKSRDNVCRCGLPYREHIQQTEAELRAAWGDR